VDFFDDCQFDDFKQDLIKLGAIVVIKTTRFIQYPNHYLTGHRSGPEPGDWYSPELVGIDEIETIITGHEILEWLQPNELDFRYRLRDVLRGQ